MENSHRSTSYGAVPYRSREGLSTRVVSNNPDEIQLRIDPMQADLDDEITGLRGKLSKLKSILIFLDVDLNVFGVHSTTQKLLPNDLNFSRGLSEELTAAFTSPVDPRRTVAQEIDTETKYQNDFITQLQMTMIKAQAGVKNNVRRLNKSIIQQGSNHVFHVILFALFCFFLVYLWSKFSRR